MLAAWQSPHLDYAALAPLIVLAAGAVLLILLDSVMLEKFKPFASIVAGATLLGSMIPVLWLADDGTDRSMFGGAFVVDNFALVLTAMFVLSGYVVVLLATNYFAEGDYWESEFYALLLSSIIGMVVMCSARDLITIFVALELLSIPAYLMATWRKRDLKSNEAGLKYYLMGVFASAIMLYGMSLVFGAAGSTLLTDVGAAIGGEDPSATVVLGMLFTIIGFAFKISAFPFHTWAPDTYEGAPTPVTAFLAVASKAAGFVAILQLVYVGFAGRDDVYQPLMWILAAGSMTAGNLMALRQKNIVRLMAYSGIAQAGYMLAPLVIAGHSAESADKSLQAIVGYLVIYAAMNLGAFGVILAVARKTRSADISSFRGLFQYAPGLTIAMTAFLMSLAGIPPLAGWFGKFQILTALLSANNASGVAMGVVLGVNSVIALYYYGSIARAMWADDVPDGDRTPIRVPPALLTAIGITVALTLLFGVLPQSVGHFTDSGLLALGGVNPLAAALAARIRADGPIGYEAFVDAALYAPGLGFYETGGRAGRRGAFLTSPEVGPLFGAVLARALTTWWDELGRPDPFTVVEVGAGPGTLARAVLAAARDQPVAAALAYVAVERSAAQRALHPDGVASVDVVPDGPLTGVILANELLDNLAFGLVERRDGGWHDVQVGVDGERLAEVRGPERHDPRLPDDAPDGARLPRQDAAAAFVHDALARLARGRLVVVDYAADDAALLARPWRDWVRTYRDHEPGGHPLDDPGTQDVTCEVARDALVAATAPDTETTQAAFLAEHGIDALVDEGRRAWQEGAATGGLAALRGRSRVREAEALCDPAGLGGFAVFGWVR